MEAHIKMALSERIESLKTVTAVIVLGNGCSNDAFIQNGITHLVPIVPTYEGALGQIAFQEENMKLRFINSCTTFTRNAGGSWSKSRNRCNVFTEVYVPLSGTYGLSF
jgi:hypothetical protein